MAPGRRTAAELQSDLVKCQSCQTLSLPHIHRKSLTNVCDTREKVSQDAILFNDARCQQPQTLVKWSRVLRTFDFSNASTAA